MLMMAARTAGKACRLGRSRTSSCGPEGMGEDGGGDEPVQVDHTAERHHNWKRGVQSLLTASLPALAPRANVTVAARIGAEALQKSRASHSTVRLT